MKGREGPQSLQGGEKRSLSSIDLFSSIFRYDHTCLWCYGDHRRSSCRSDKHERGKDMACKNNIMTSAHRMKHTHTHT